MNIYLHVEIASRELDAKLLLGLVAAERGHDVVVGSIENMRTPLLKGWFPPGIFHTKDLCPTPNKVAFLKELKSRGFWVTSQDEETSLIHDDPEQIFHSNRFGIKSLECADSVFFFGQRDCSILSQVYPAFRNKFLVTGSPRIDLWRTTAKARHQEHSNKSPYFGILSNFGFPFLDEPIVEWLARSLRDNEFKDSFDFWNSGIRGQLCNVEPALQFIEMIESVAKARPDTHFVVRPHPTESVGAWEHILGNRCANVTVEKKGSTHDFLVDAQGIIHSGCTTGFEAFFSQVPCISYCFAPDDGGYRSASALVNRLGIVTTNPAQVCAAIDSLKPGIKPEDTISSDIKAELAKRVCSVGDLGGAHRIVDAWEAASATGVNAGKLWNKAGALLAAREVKFSVHQAIAKSESTKGTTEIKFPDLSKQKMLARVAHIKKRSGLASSVKASRLDRQLFLLKS